jgi:osmotically-inducible protein OsmY
MPRQERERSREREWNDDETEGRESRRFGEPQSRGRWQDDDYGGAPSQSRHEESGRGGGWGGDYGRWQEGERYGRGYGKDRNEQFASDYGPRGRFGREGYAQGGDRADMREYGRGRRSSYGGGGMGDFAGGGNFGNQNYGNSSYGAGSEGGSMSDYAGNTGTEGAYPREYNEMYGHGGQGDQGFGGPYAQGGQFGRHRGKGPKNYTRSDDRIREEVCDVLTRDSHIDASDIEVKVKDGEVTVSGTVDHRRFRRRAEETIEDISGVKHVQNDLRVKDRDFDKGTESAGAGKPSAAQTSLGSPKTA